MSIVDWLKSIEERFERGINSDESVTFYPSYGFRDQQGAWQMEVRGIISEELRILKHLPRIALQLAGVPSADRIADLLGEAVKQVEVTRNFQERTQAFLVDGESDEEFQIESGEQSWMIGRSDQLGYFNATVSLPGEMVPEGDSWLSFKALDNDLKRHFLGSSQITQPAGITVVSDIDDTIKDSNVPEPHELIVNTLFLPFRAVEGMARVYKDWHKRGAAFIYLTNSPYQLFTPLHEYLQAIFPQGAYYMRRLDRKALQAKIDQLVAADEEVGLKENPKKHNLIPILERFPGRQFILVGDSTEMDAEIYTDLYLGRNFPDGLAAKPYGDRIRRIYIRNAPTSKAETRDAARAAIEEIQAAAGSEAALMFSDPAEISQHSRQVFG